MKLNKEEFELVESFLSEWSDSIRPNYSGRGMYGKTCLGIIVSNISQIFIIGYYFYEYCQNNDLDCNIEDFRISVDSMGYDQIVYFHNVQVEYTEDDEDDEDDDDLEIN